MLSTNTDQIIDFAVEKGVLELTDTALTSEEKGMIVLGLVLTVLAIIASSVWVIYQIWLRKTIRGARYIVDNVYHYMQDEASLVESSISRIMQRKQLHQKDMQRLKRAVTRFPILCDIVEQGLKYEQQIEMYIDILELEVRYGWTSEATMQDKAYKRLEALAHPGDQQVIDALMKKIVNDSAVKTLEKLVPKEDPKIISLLANRIKGKSCFWNEIRLLGHIANQGNKQAIHALIQRLNEHDAFAYEVAHILAKLATKGDQDVIRALLPYLSGATWDVEILNQLGASVSQLFPAVLKSGDITLLRSIVNKGELIAPLDPNREKKTSLARDALIDAYIEKITSHDNRGAEEGLLMVAKRGNARAIKGLLKKLKGCDQVIDSLALITDTNNQEVLSALYEIIRSRSKDIDHYSSDRYNVARALNAVDKIGTHMPADIRAVDERLTFLEALEYDRVEYCVDKLLALSSQQREKVFSVIKLIWGKLNSIYPEYFGDKWDDSRFAIMQQDVDKAVALYKRYGDFNVIYHKAVWGGSSDTDGVTTIGGGGIVERAYLEIVPR